MKVIIINGTARAGKDTVVEFAQELLKETHIVTNISTIDPIKKAMEILGWDGKKDDEDRLIMAKLKQLAIESFDGPFKYIKDTVKTGENCVNFIHCREPEEITKIKNYYGKINCITLLVNRKGIHIPINGADDVVENYVYDYIIDNSGSISKLKKRVSDFLFHFEIKKLHFKNIGNLNFEGFVKLDF